MLEFNTETEQHPGPQAANSPREAAARAALELCRVRHHLKHEVPAIRKTDE
jgi:hypothetical protein